MVTDTYIEDQEIGEPTTIFIISSWDFILAEEDLKFVHDHYLLHTRFLCSSSYNFLVYLSPRHLLRQPTTRELLCRDEKERGFNLLVAPALTR